MYITVEKEGWESTGNKIINVVPRFSLACTKKPVIFKRNFALLPGSTTQN